MSETPDLLLGGHPLSSRLHGYEVRARVGSGNVGQVFRARQPDQAREVAIKVIPPAFASQPDFIRRFEVEAERLAGLRHPHIAPLYDYWRSPDGAFLVTRWLPGSLQLALGQGSWNLRAAARLVGQMTGALSLAHSQNVFHGNIKPSNVLLDEDQNAYLVDFAGVWTSASGVPGLPLDRSTVLAPELVMGAPPSRRTDVYGLGILLFRVLFPAPAAPAGGAPGAERLDLHHELIRHIRTDRPDLPAGVLTVIETALAPNPSDRYTDPAQMATALEAAAGTSPLSPGALTERERVILHMVAADLTNAQVGERLSLSAETVKWYLQAVYTKLDVHSRVQAVQRAQELGMLHAVSRTVLPEVAGPQPAAAAGTVPSVLRKNPYKGLRAFQEVDSPDFFGREALVAQLLARMSEPGPFSRFLAVVGPSGSGKSSAVRAGLIPALRCDGVPGSDRWFIGHLLPGGHPIEETQVVLTTIAARMLPHLYDELRRDERGLLRVARMILPQEAGQAEENQLLLVIDQFEEVFTLCTYPAERMHFLDSLYTAVTDIRSTVRIVITLRADFFDRPLMHEGFSELLDKRTQVVGPLRAEELERAVVAPAQRSGVGLEDGLVTAISADVNQQPGALPLLQYALTELFEQRQDGKLTLSAYRAMNGVQGVLARRAEEVYSQLGEAGQKAARQVFLRLVTLGEGVEDTRRRVLLSELRALGNADTVQDIIDSFDRTRLLTFDRDPAAHSPTVELAHEAILREWQRLRAWLDESRTDVRLQRLLAASAADWLVADRDASYLLHGGRLALYKSWRQATTMALTDDEQTYLDTSLQAEQRAVRLRRRVRRAVVGVSLVVAVIMTSLALLATSRERQAQEDRARAERQAAVNRSLVLANAALDLFDSDGGYALPLALEAVRVDEPPTRSVNALQQIAFGAGTRSILREAGNPIRAVAFSPDGQRALSGSCTTLDSGVCALGELILWDVLAESEVWRAEAHAGAVIAVSFSPNGQAVWTAGEDGTLIRWDVASGQLLQTLDSAAGVIRSAVFSTDGRLAITAGADGLVRVLDLVNGEVRYALDSGVGTVTLVALSADRRLAASDAGTAIVLWDVASGAEIRRLTGHTDTPTAFAFRPTGPDSYTVLSSSKDTTVLETDVATGEILHRSVVMSDFFTIAVSPEGSVAMPSSGFGPQLWNVERWTETQTVGDRLGKVESAAFSPDGRTILMGHASGMLRLLDLPVSAEVRRYVSDIPLESIDVSPDGRYLIGGAFTGGAAVLFDVATGHEIRRFPMPEDMVLARFSPDGRTLAIGSANYFPSTREHTILLVDVTSGETLHELDGLVYHPRSMAFTPDGRYVLVGSLEWGTAFEGTGAGDLLQWDVQTGELYRRYDETRAVFGITFSPDASKFVTMTDSQGDPVRAKVSYLTVWDLATGARLNRYYDWPETGLASSAAWDPDGEHVYVGGFGGLARLDLATGAAPFAFRGLGSDSVFGMDISPDQRYLAAGDIQVPSTFIVWDRATAREMLRAMPYDVPIWDVVFGPDSRSVFTSPYGPGPIIQWRVPDLTLGELLAWVRDNRHVRDFTCEERVEFNILPLCDSETP